jgi:hypothetical protein
MEDFHNPDGTMRSADDIAAMWKTWNIQPEQHVAFYCGTGWRASEAPYVRTGDGLEKRLRLRWRLVRMEQPSAKPGFHRGARPESSR